MDRKQSPFDPEEVREELRLLKNELFAQPPLEFVDDMKLRRKLVDVIARASEKRHRRS